ncbi:MAG: AAA family ATPase [Caldilineaceae bacterium]
MSPTKQSELTQLFQEFQQQYVGGEAAQAFLGALADARQRAQRHYQQILTAAERAEPITDAVLLKLLPYTDTPRNRWRGAWVHPAPAIVGDLRSWYEAAGWTQPDEWPAIAGAILHFVRQCVDEPTHLTAACQSFRLLPYTTGFQGGILSPILNALRPERYWLFNQDVRRALNYFTDSAFTQSLTDYPAANTALHTLLTALSTLPVWANVPPVSRNEHLLLFCHWLVKEKDFRFRPRRYWTLGVDADAWLWQEWREGKMITTGWDELGDLSGVRKREFGQRRDSLIAQHPDWRKGSAEQVWRFARQLQEGDLVLVHRGPVVLGICTICGPYYYVPELPQGHRHPVEWRDLTSRRLPGEGWGQELASIPAERFATLAGAPLIEAVTMPSSQPAADGEAPPDFMRWLAPLVNTLQALGGSGRAGEVVEAVLTGMAETKTRKPGEFERQKQQLYQARRLLLRAGLLDSSQRGVWRLTEAGKALTLNEDAATTLFAETLYQQRLAASLRGESTTIRRLAEQPVTYTTQPTTTAPAQTQTSAEPAENTDGAPPVITVSAPYPLSACAAATFLPEATLARWVSAIERKGQAIFYGPPGVGKTFLAEQLAAHLAGGDQPQGGDGFVEVVQFHAAYAYEDFVQGIRPVAGPSGQVRYEVIAGRFLAFCQRAAQCTGRCVLIIDEINRADLARVFGELMYLLEYRTRTVRLAADGRAFAIPANVRILGTMNTADRSIALLDHALRRRFAFIALQPDYEVLRRFHDRHDTGFAVEALIDLLRRVNSEIGDAHYTIGHSFFLRTNLATELPDIWQLEIEPYLEEYFFDQPERVAALRWAQVKGVVAQSM